MAQPKTAIQPTRQEDYPAWYQQVIKAADLAENSDVRGCMVIKPWGYALWENIRTVLDKRFREHGVRNAYFPLFIPRSYFEKEAEHVQGFAKECAVVTHSRLEDDGNGGLRVAGKLTEEYIVRPTSETIIGASFSRWVNSWRDLPLLINQWANVVRWEMRPRLFLRTAEFLWQEGHTVHASSEEAWQMTTAMLDEYAAFARDWLAMPVIKGKKSALERFPGAVETLCIEGMMQDRKALQCGTSHFLGQNFAHASEIKFQNKAGVLDYAWTTSWGLSTRLIGALIMTHSDDDGLVLPPRIAPAQLVIIPIYRDEEQHAKVMEFVKDLAARLHKLPYGFDSINVEVDDSDATSSERNWNWVKKGVPVRVEVGMRDIEGGNVCFARRDLGVRDKVIMPVDEFVSGVTAILDEIQTNLLQRAEQIMQTNTKVIANREEFYRWFTPHNADKPEIHGGFAYAPWCGCSECEEKIKEDLRVTLRLIPMDAEESSEGCLVCGKKPAHLALFAKNY